MAPGPLARTETPDRSVASSVACYQTIVRARRLRFPEFPERSLQASSKERLQFRDDHSISRCFESSAEIVRTGRTEQACPSAHAPCKLVIRRVYWILPGSAYAASNMTCKVYL